MSHWRNYPSPNAFASQWGRWCVSASLMTISLLVVACVPPKVNTQSAPGFDPYTIRKLVIFPFQALQTPQRAAGGGSQYPEAPSEVRTQFILPGEGALRGTEGTTEAMRVSEAAAKRITSMVYANLQGRPGVRIASPFEVAQAFSDQGKRDPSLGWRDQVTQLGKSLEADAVLIGLVRVYRERKGSKIAATPAVVGFETHLIDSSNGKALWSGTFYDEQKPLNQDAMGFWERKGMYITADELARTGVEKLMEDFPVGR